jgi:2-keto-4-pentenoate hydratase
MRTIGTAGFVIGTRRFATRDAASAAAGKIFAKTGVVVGIEAVAATIGESIERMARAAGHRFGPGDSIRMGDRLVSWEYLMST